MNHTATMKTNNTYRIKAGLSSLRISGRGLMGFAAVCMAICVQGATPTFYENKSAFIAALGTNTVSTQTFNGFGYMANLSGVTLLPGVYATSTFSNLVVWGSGSMFGYDDGGHTRIAGRGAYEFHLTGKSAIGFDIVAWDPSSLGPARAVVHLADGSSYQVERWQTGPTESTPVFFGVTADQSIVRVEWHESPEYYGGGNEEVGIDNLMCIDSPPPTPPTPTTIAGTWEPDVYTGHAARLSIRQSGASWFIHGWGSCSPTPCDWGEVALNRITPRAEGAFDGYFAVWEFSFKKTYAWVKLQNGGLLLETIDIYSDNSGRQPASMISRMHLVANTVAVSLGAAAGSSAYTIPVVEGYTLQRCNDLSCEAWVDVPLAEGSAEYTITRTDSQAFFRLVKVAE